MRLFVCAVFLFAVFAIAAQMAAIGDASGLYIYGYEGYIMEWE